MKLYLRDEMMSNQTKITNKRSDDDSGRFSGGIESAGSRGFIWLGVWLLTEVISVVVVTFLLTLGLILRDFVANPLAMVVGGILIGLTAVGLSNLVVKDGLQSPVDGVVPRVEVAAIILAIILVFGSLGGWLPTPNIIPSVLTATVLAGVAVFSAYQLRRVPESDPRQKVRVALWLLGAIGAIPLVIFLADLLGWAGA